MRCDYRSVDLGLSYKRKIDEKFDRIRLTIGKPEISCFWCKSRGEKMEKIE